MPKGLLTTMCEKRDRVVAIGEVDIDISQYGVRKALARNKISTYELSGA